MQFLSFLLVALPLAAALPSSPAQGSSGLSNARRAGLGESCRKSSECGSVDNYCRRGRCDVRKPLGNKCYKNIGCISNSCSNKVCTEGAALTLNERCETSKSCQSGYCGKSKCQVPQPVGAECYKAVGCLSGICTDGKCAAPAPTETKPNEPTDEPGNVALNGHFENPDLDYWYPFGQTTRSEEDKTAYDGLHYAVLKSSANKDDQAPGLYQSVYTAPPPPRRGLSRREPAPASGANAYDVTFQYKVPQFALPKEGDCSIIAIYLDQEVAQQSPPVKVDKTVTEWTKGAISIKKPYGIITDIAVAVDCLSASTFYLDDINFVPTGYPTKPTDVARNGGFEDATGDPWVFDGSAGVETTDASFGAKYARIHQAGSLKQAVVVPEGSIQEGYTSYRVKFQYLVKSFGLSTPPPQNPSCSFATSVGSDAADQSTVQSIVPSNVDANSEEYKSYSRIITSSTSDPIASIKIELTCESGSDAEIYIDQVEFLPRTAA